MRTNFSIAKIYFVLVLGPVAAHSEVFNCAQLIGKTSKKEEMAAAEASAALKSIMAQSKAMPKTIKAPEIPDGNATIRFTINEIGLKNLMDKVELYKKGSAETEPAENRSPGLYSISQIRISKNQNVLLKPNVAQSIQTQYGMMPLIAKLSEKGQFEDIKPMFSNEEHPLSRFSRLQYDYDIGINLKTSVGRAIFTIVDKYEEGYDNVDLGKADVFFVDSVGKELPSLMTVLQKKANHVVALNESLYFVETLSGKPMIVEYNPTVQDAKVIYQFGGSAKDKDMINSLFRMDANRDGLSVSRYQGQLRVLTQTHDLILDLESDAAESVPKIFPTATKLESGNRANIANIQNGVIAIKVTNTLSKQKNENYILRFVLKAGAPGTLLRFNDENLIQKAWVIPGKQNNPRVFRVKNGFVMQKNSHQSTSDIIIEPKLRTGADRRLIFLGDDGSVKQLTSDAFPAIGDVTIVDGVLMFIGEGGKVLKIEDHPEWR